MNLPFKTLIILERNSSVPLYTQVANKLIMLISQGKILPGTFLPATRVMAAMLDIHRKTVIQAYEEMDIQGWIEPVSRKGYCVLRNLPIVKPRSFQPKDHFQPQFVDVADSFLQVPATAYPEAENYSKQAIVVDDGFPDIRLSPFVQFLNHYKSIVRDDQARSLMMENNEGGQLHLRVSVSTFLNETRGLNIGYAHLMITRGAQMSIFIAAALLIKPGDKVIVSRPNYFMADQIFRQMGADLYQVPVDGEGMDVNELEQLLKKHRFKMLYIIPHHHHPTTVTMGTNRRIELLSLIKQHDLWVIEDDYDYDFHYHNSPILPLASGNHNGKIIYIGSYTKLLGASFRIGYMVAGKAFIQQAMSYRRLMDIRGDFMMEEALARLIDNGEMAKHIKRSVKVYTERFECAKELLRHTLDGSAFFKPPQGGMAIWLQFNQEHPLSKVVALAKSEQLYMKGSAYDEKQHPALNGIRFGFASLNTAELKKAVEILQKVLQLR